MCHLVIKRVVKNHTLRGGGGPSHLDRKCHLVIKRVIQPPNPRAPRCGLWSRMGGRQAAPKMSFRSGGSHCVWGRAGWWEVNIKECNKIASHAHNFLFISSPLFEKRGTVFGSGKRPPFLLPSLLTAPNQGPFSGPEIGVAKF